MRNGGWLALATVLAAACGVHTGQNGGIQITSVSPATGSMNGGAAITIKGQGLDDGSHVAKVYFGINQATVTSLDATTAQVVLPAGLSCGQTDVKLQNAYGSGLLPGGFSYSGGNAQLAISAMVPSSGAIAGGTQVTITGSGFTGGVGFTLSGAPLQNITVVNDTTVTAVTGPTQAGGVSDLSARNCATQASLPGAFVYLSGMLGGVTELVLTNYGNPGQFAAPTPQDVVEPYAEFFTPTAGPYFTDPPTLGTCAFNYTPATTPAPITDLDAGTGVTLVNGGTTVAAGAIPQQTFTTNGQTFLWYALAAPDMATTDYVSGGSYNFTNAGGAGVPGFTATGAFSVPPKPASTPDLVAAASFQKAGSAYCFGAAPACDATNSYSTVTKANGMTWTWPAGQAGDRVEIAVFGYDASFNPLNEAVACNIADSTGKAVVDKATLSMMTQSAFALTRIRRMREGSFLNTANGSMVTTLNWTEYWGVIGLK